MVIILAPVLRIYLNLYTPVNLTIYRCELDVLNQLRMISDILRDNLDMM